MIERPSLHALALFLSVVEHGTMTAAAEIEGVAQSAISVHIHNLEGHFGVPLLERTSRRVRPTAYGEVVASYTRQMLHLVDEMGDALKSLDELRTGRLVIGASATVAETWLPQMLGRYRQAYPGIEVEVSIGNSEHIIHAIQEWRLGLGVVGRAGNSPDLEAHPVFRDELEIFAASDSPLLDRSPLLLEDLKDETLVLREPGSATREFMIGCLQAREFTPSRTIQLGSNEAVKRAVAAGLGIGILSSQTLDVDVRAGDIAILDCVDWQCHREFWLLKRRDRTLSRAETAFRELAAA